MDVIRRALVDYDKIQGPRRLPVVCFGQIEYFVDERLREFRRVNNPYRRVVFDSAKGIRMLRGFYVDVCRSCYQDVAIPRSSAAMRVMCPVCGGSVQTQDA